VGKLSAIEWTDATFNPWWGCSRVSPACAHCYADTFAHRWGLELWAEGGARRFFGEKHWNEPRVWNRNAQAAGEPLKVFCASMADVFEDHSGLDVWREKLWDLVAETPWLHWQLLTKRPENVLAMSPWANEWPHNVWIGASIENSRFTFRADLLREVPCAVRFISAEPLLGSLFVEKRGRAPLDLAGISWLIVGGESGPRARPMELAWARELRSACADEGVAFFLKQLGGVRDKRGGQKARLDRRLWREFPYAPAVPVAA
jgi:protein gp37